ncbi:hypothetical protein [Desulfomicrobium salsuginis]
MNASEMAKELGFMSDLVGLVNNNFEDIHKETRAEMMILVSERLGQLRRVMLGEEIRR